LKKKCKEGGDQLHEKQPQLVEGLVRRRKKQKGVGKNIDEKRGKQRRKGVG